MNHRTTKIYRSALQLTLLSARVIEGLPPGYGFLSDQLRRAAASVLLNFAEGCGKRSVRDRRRFFNIAKGSSYEVAAVMDVAQAFGFITDEVHEDGLDRCDHIGAMLSRFR